MNKDNVVAIKKPERFVDDPISDILRQGARDLLAHALEAEIEIFLNQYKDLRDEAGLQRIVRNGYLPERQIQTGIGPVPVEVPRTRDRSLQEAERVSFRSAILPPYLRKTRSMEQLIPWLYLKGVSTGDFSDALAALVGKDAPGLSAPTISRLKTVWQQEFQQWQKRNLSEKRYVYFWADGIYCNVRMDDKQCLLVIIGATAEGVKELVAIEGGFRESELSWKQLLLDLKSRGLTTAPQLAIGDGALGFWKALSKVYNDTRWQRCWVHKTANVLNNLPKSLQSKAKSQLHQLWQAASKDEAQRHFNDFVNTYEAKYPKAAQCLEKDRDALFTFYDFPAEHWRHIRTTNPIESTFATVRLRTNKVRGCFSASTVISMAFK
jgi:transposase-like protein